MSEKVKVSKNVAEVIESLIDLASTSSIGYVITEFEKNEYKDKRINLMREMFDTPTFIKVLVFRDYEVELTPVEMLIQQYRYTLENFETMKMSDYESEELYWTAKNYRKVVLEGIRDTLAILKIKIKGVNA